MAILAECPICHRKQAAKNKFCSSCGQDLDRAKRSKKVRYWIAYRLPNGKQRREICDKERPYSIEVAQAAHGKRVSQRYENPSILKKVPDERMTFKELAEWFTGLKSIKKLATHDRVKGCLENFNAVFGNRIVATIKPVDLEDYQDQREKQGRAAATIDMELTWTKAMIDKAFLNDKVSGHTLKVFKTFKRKLKRGDNARKRTLTFAEYQSLTKEGASHLKPMVIVAYNTGMRTGEIRQLRWSHIDHDKGFIRLPAEITKEKREKNIPMNHHVRKVLAALPRAVHHDYVFTYRGNPIKARGGLKTSFKTACKAAKIPCGRKAPNGIIFHDIRRTVKTNMLNAGVDKVHRDVILGHSLKGMDLHYMAPSEEDLH